MKRFILLCALLVMCSSATFAQEDKITQGVVTTTTNTTYTTVTQTKQVRMSDEEWAEYKRQQKLKRQAYRDSIAVVNQAHRDSMALVNAARYKADSAKRAANAVLARERRVANAALAKERNVAVGGWRNYLNINISGAEGVHNEGFTTPSIGIEYIGGMRFNRFIFLGFGSGVVFNTQRNGGELVNRQRFPYLDYNQSAKSLGLCAVSFPLYANFRLYMSSRKCQPYISLSTGFRFSGNKREQVSAYSILSSTEQKNYKNSSHIVKYGTTQYFLSPGLGLDFVGKSGKGVSLQASFFAVTMPMMYAKPYGKRLSIDVKPSFRSGYHVQLGFTF